MIEAISGPREGFAQTHTGWWVPERFVPQCEPGEVFWRVNGIRVGEFGCPGCGLIIESQHYPTTFCPDCRVPLPNRCCTRDCQSVVYPSKDKLGWLEASPFCADCERDSGREKRAENLKCIPAAIRSAASTGYRPYQHRAALDKALAEWIQNRRQRVTRPSMYVCGPVGTGKTVAVARAACKAVIDGVFADVLWVRENTMLQWAKTMFGDDPEPRKMLQRAQGVPLLVIDEIFASPSSYTDHAREVIGNILSVRFERGAAVLFTSNEPPIFGVVFDGRAAPEMQRMQSRFEGSASYVKLTEHIDLRRQ